MTAIAACAGLLLFIGSTLSAAVGDVMTYRISNKLVAVMAVSYALLAPLTGLGLQQLGMSAVAAAAVLGGGFWLFTIGAIGGGDAKFAAAAALWLGHELVPAFILATAVAGGVVAVALLFLQHVKLPSTVMSVSWVERILDGRSGVPYGLALSAAALVLLPSSHWVSFL